MGPITEFQGEYRFLSNFWPAEVEYEGDVYASVEHAYQAAKTLDRNGRAMIQRAASPGIAKRLGQNLPIRPDWENVKVGIMSQLVTEKFFNHKELQRKLLATGERDLIEGNYWGDTFWGVYRGKGSNYLGKILVAVRAGIRGSRA